MGAVCQVDQTREGLAGWGAVWANTEEGKNMETQGTAHSSVHLECGGRLGEETAGDWGSRSCWAR